MDWLRNLLGRRRNPEQFERVRCEVCNGTGLVLQTGAPGGPAGNQQRGRIPHCGKCRGRGYVMVKRPET